MTPGEIHSVKCPWCGWTRSDRSAYSVACRLVSHANYQHDVWLPLDRAELFVLGDPGVNFSDMRAKQRAENDTRPWSEIRGVRAA